MPWNGYTQRGGQGHGGKEVLGYPQRRAPLTQHENRGVVDQTCIDLVEAVALLEAVA